MRTKTTLVAAAILAAGLASSMAQNVYSLNVVGYVNVNLVPGFNAIALQLKGSPDSNLNTVFTGATIPDGTLLFTWNTATGDFNATTPQYSTASSSWSPNVPLVPGLGYFMYAPSSFTQTFVGDVIQTTTTTQIVPGFNILANPQPIEGNANVVCAGMTPAQGDLVLTWDTATGDFFSTPSEYAGTSWTASLNSTNGVGKSFLYYSGAPGTVNWVKNYTVPQTP